MYLYHWDDIQNPMGDSKEPCRHGAAKAEPKDRGGKVGGREKVRKGSEWGPGVCACVHALACVRVSCVSSQFKNYMEHE